MIPAVFSFHKTICGVVSAGCREERSHSVRVARSAEEILPPSYQPQDPPSETLGGALRVDIREIEQQSRSSITTHRPIR